MSTWGTGLFSSDGAQDLLEEIADLEESERSAELEKVFRELLDDPSRLMQSVFPEPLIAAAAIVALSLSGGERILERQNGFVSSTVEEAALDRPAPHLAAEALQVLTIVTAPAGPWGKGWRSAADKEEALAEIETVKEILEAVSAA